MNPLIIAMCIPLAPRDQNRMQILGDVAVVWHAAAVRLHNVLHDGLDAERGVVGVARLDEQVVKYLAEAADFLVRVWVHGVGLEDQHAHFGVMFGDCLDGGEGAHGRRWSVEVTCGVSRR